MSNTPTRYTHTDAGYTRLLFKQLKSNSHKRYIGDGYTKPIHTNVRQPRYS